MRRLWSGSPLCKPFLLVEVKALFSMMTRAPRRPFILWNCYISHVPESQKMLLVNWDQQIYVSFKICHSCKWQCDSCFRIIITPNNYLFSFFFFLSPLCMETILPTTFGWERCMTWPITSSWSCPMEPGRVLFSAFPFTTEQHHLLIL